MVATQRNYQKSKGLKAGLNGFWKDLFKKVITGVCGALGTTLGGPLGGAIGLALGEWVNTQIWKNNFDLPEYLHPQYENWADYYFKPFIEEIATTIKSTSNSDYSNPSYIARYNEFIRKLSALAAYYQFVSENASKQDEVLLNQAYALTVREHIKIFVASFQEVTSPYSFSQQQFYANVYKNNIGQIPVNWQGASVVAYTEVLTKPTNGGGTISGGGGTPTKPGTGFTTGTGTNTGGTTPVGSGATPTNSGNDKPSTPNTGGQTLPPVTNPKPTTPKPNTPVNSGGGNSTPVNTGGSMPITTGGGYNGSGINPGGGNYTPVPTVENGGTSEKKANNVIKILAVLAIGYAVLK